MPACRNLIQFNFKAKDLFYERIISKSEFIQFDYFIDHFFFARKFEFILIKTIISLNCSPTCRKKKTSVEKFPRL